MKPNKFHSKYVCFGGRKTREERKLFLKIHLFGSPDVLVPRSATTAARKVVSSSTLIGPFECKHAQLKFKWFAFPILLKRGVMVYEDKKT